MPKHFYGEFIAIFKTLYARISHKLITVFSYSLSTSPNNTTVFSKDDKSSFILNSLFLRLYTQALHTDVFFLKPR